MTAGDLVPIETALGEIARDVADILSDVLQDDSVDLSSIQSVLEDIQTAVSSMVHPMLSTPVQDYTVTEGLLLLIFLFLIFRELGRALSALYRRFF